eukprot:scaffold600_cov385-Prasinococcus_capsulatus_cf.AAC.5
MHSNNRVPYTRVLWTRTVLGLGERSGSELKPRSLYVPSFTGALLGANSLGRTARLKSNVSSISRVVDEERAAMADRRARAELARVRTSDARCEYKPFSVLLNDRRASPSSNWDSCACCSADSAGARGHLRMYVSRRRIPTLLL